MIIGGFPFLLHLYIFPQFFYKNHGWITFVTKIKEILGNPFKMHFILEGEEHFISKKQ